MNRGRWSLPIAVVALLVGCATTRVTTAWRAPTAKPVAFTRVLAVVATDDQSLRRVGEMEICKRVQPTSCTPSFEIFPTGPRPPVEEAKARVTAAGFDGAIVFRLLGQREQQTYVPPSYGQPFSGGFYGRAYPMMTSPGYVRSDTLVKVETTVYDLEADQLVWVGTTETLNPKDVPDLVDGVATAVAADMRAHGLLPPRAE
jgi:hypothetical protein